MKCDRRDFIKGSIGTALLAILPLGKLVTKEKPIKLKKCSKEDLTFNVKPKHTITQKGNWEIDVTCEPIETTTVADYPYRQFQSSYQYWVARLQKSLPIEWMGDAIKIKLVGVDYNIVAIGLFTGLTRFPKYDEITIRGEIADLIIKANA